MTKQLAYDFILAGILLKEDGGNRVPELMRG